MNTKTLKPEEEDVKGRIIARAKKDGKRVGGRAAEDLRGITARAIGGKKAKTTTEEKKMSKKAEHIMIKIAKKDGRPEPGYWATHMAASRSMRRGDTGVRKAIATDDLIGSRMSQGLKYMAKGLGIGAGVGAGVGLATNIASKANTIGKVKGTGLGAAIGGAVGLVIGDDVGMYKADKAYLADRGIGIRAMGFKRPSLTAGAKKKYLSSKYQGGGFDVNKKK